MKPRGPVYPAESYSWSSNEMRHGLIFDQADTKSYYYILMYTTASPGQASLTYHSFRTHVFGNGSNTREAILMLRAHYSYVE